MESVHPRNQWVVDGIREQISRDLFLLDKERDLVLVDSEGWKLEFLFFFKVVGCGRHDWPTYRTPELDMVGTRPTALYQWQAACTACFYPPVMSCGIRVCKPRVDFCELAWLQILPYIEWTTKYEALLPPKGANFFAFVISRKSYPTEKSPLADGK